MKKFLFGVFALLFTNSLIAQETYTMGYEGAIIEVKDPRWFTIFEFPGQEAVCGIHDVESETFYTCDKRTFRYVDADYVSERNTEMCCSIINFDPMEYYGTLTMKGVIDSVAWDDMIVYFTTDKARFTIQVDEREIDALYDKFYKRYQIGPVNLILRLNTFDTPNENVISYNKNTERKRKPTRTFTKVYRW